jgi:hypothetical protein
MKNAMKPAMQNDDQSCACRLCDQPMRLIRRLPQIDSAPELLVYYCRECNEVDSAGWRQSPLRSAAATMN